jgi:hypothetical protein
VAAPSHARKESRPCDLNRPSSERGVGDLEALGDGDALGGWVGSTSNRPGGHGNEEKNARSTRCVLSCSARPTTTTAGIRIH